MQFLPDAYYKVRNNGTHYINIIDTAYCVDIIRQAKLELLL